MPDGRGKRDLEGVRKMKSQAWKIGHVLAGLFLLGRPAAALERDAGDNIAIPDGITGCATYYYYGKFGKINIKGIGDIKTKTGQQVQAGVLSCFRSYEVGDLTIVPIFFIPVAGQYDVELGGVRIPGATGFGDPSVGAQVYLYKDPTEGRYFSLYGFVNVPLGTYDARDAINIGANRYKFDITAAYTQNIISDKFSVDLFAAGLFYTENQNYSAYHLTLRQDPSLQLQAFLSYLPMDGTRISIGYMGHFFGNQYVSGIRNGLQTNEHMLRFSVAQMLSPTTQALVEVSRDIAVKGGSFEELRIQTRFVWVF
ncbi:transporter [Methylobacterium sp. ID0610]|uniref:transporter n=1 Tax=Methylobacterium carpenticola TaxID=3344827 RepID=UPI00368A1D4B